MQGRGRTWARRIGLTAGLLVLVTGGYVAVEWTSVNARYAGHRFQTAETSEEQTRWAERLIELGPAGNAYLLAPFHDGDPARCQVAVAVLQAHLAQIPPSDPRYAATCRPILDGFGSFADTGKTAAAELVPDLLKCSEADAAARCRDAVRAALVAPSAEGRVRAVRLALHPLLRLQADVVPLLSAPEPEVRRAALLAVGPVLEGETPVIGDEELFRWLHDPDPEVRDLCESALQTRGLDGVQVHLARQLTHPDAAERLKLLVDLSWASGTVKDPGPWLERLSRDADPAVRLGAARVAAESRLVFAGWLDRMADSDPDPTVRHWAAYYRSLSATVRQTGGTSPDR